MMAVNGRPRPTLFDRGIERAYVVALLQDPSRHDLVDVGLTDFTDPHAFQLFKAFANVRARGDVTVAAVRAELAANGVVAAVSGLRADPHRGWFDEFIDLQLPLGAPVAGWANTIVRLAKQRRELVEAADQEEIDIDRDALSDAEPPRLDERERAHPETSATKPRWIAPLDSFLGPDEPDDDDSSDWVIRDIIPRGEPAILAGPPKSGKTWALLDLAMAVATGTHWLGGAQQNTMGRPARVLVIALEDGARRLAKRIWELARGRGIRPNEDPVLRAHLSITRTPLRLPDRTDERDFTADLKRWKPDLVLIDNLTRVMVGDQNAIKDVAAFTKLWAQMCTDVGAAFLYLHHTGKAGPVKAGQDARDPFELVRGSGDLVAAARNVIVMRPMRAEDDEVAPGDLLMADMRIRGNLDLRRESLVAGFERTQDTSGRWSTRLRDMGDASAVRTELATKRKEAGKAKRAAEAATEMRRRRDLALDIARRAGACSSADLAAALDLSPRAVAPVLAALVRDGAMQPDRARGYVLSGGAE